jgi:hypothetical protein
LAALATHELKARDKLGEEVEKLLLSRLALKASDCLSDSLEGTHAIGKDIAAGSVKAQAWTW